MQMLKKISIEFEKTKHLIQSVRINAEAEDGIEPITIQSYEAAGYREFLFSWDEIPKKSLFSWDEIPGNDSRFIEFLHHNFDIDWVKEAKIEKIEEDNAIRVSHEENHLLMRLNDEKTGVNLKIDDGRTAELLAGLENGKLNIYQENINPRLIQFLKQNFDIEWVKTAIFEKIEENNAIRASYGENYLILRLNDEKTRVILEIDDGRTEKLIAEFENDRLNIYDGVIVDFEGIEGYVELERYWVNEPFSFISIQFNETNDDLIYCIVEPELTPFEVKLLSDVYERARDVLSYQDLIEGVDKKDILTIKVKEIIDKYIPDYSYKSFFKILYYMLRNNIGFSRIDPLIKDERIEDISCSGPNIPVYLYHRIYENIRTNLVFEEEELNSFVFLLAQRSGKNISIAKPYLDATLSDGSRLQETLGREISTRGSSFTIRKFKETPITPIDLIKWGTFNVEMMAFMWLAIENNKSLILAGGTASGKTTSLNAISLFIPLKSKIVTLEDTRELQLFHENWMAGLTREPFTAGGKGAVDMYELLRQGLRQRPEYLIVGEVRGREALTLFQAMSTGHTTYSTMHAGSVQAAINRLENDPINVPRVMMTSLDILCVQGAIYMQGKRVRRILNVIEFIDLDQETRSLNTLETFTWDPVSDSHNGLMESQVLNDIAEKRGWSYNQLESALMMRKQVLQYMVDQDIMDYNSVVSIIKDFQINPGRLLKKLNIEDSGNEF